MTEEQRTRLGKLWKEKQKVDPNMKNRDRSFIRILEYTAKGLGLPSEKLPAKK